MRFAGKRVWITGASSGIGEATARAFAAEGAHLILSSRRPAELERVRLSCDRPADHLVLPLDLTRSDTFPAVADQAQARGPIDILVNNGGVSQRALAVETAPEVERALMEVDYFGTVALTKVVLPGMIARRAGHLVVVSSVMGFVGTPGRSTYAAAKHALHGYFDSLRAEVWRHGILVTLVCPGYVRTAVSANALGPRGEQHGRTDATHQTGIAAEKCAAALLQGVARRRREVYVGGWEVAGIYLQRFCPALFAQVVRRMSFSVHAGPHS
ncbi:MAG: SDR family oxidoreductase [Verrucomicrobia bacterium]|nr:SDR family oxidoreductase [Verrucomicrobiota bacterium]